MKFQSPLFLQVLRRYYPSAALLVMCALFIHALDTCVAHWGIFATGSAPIAQTLSHQCDAGANCEICSPTENQQDGCNALAEIAVLNASQQLDQHVIFISASPALAAATPRLIFATRIFASRAGPAFAAPTSVLLRSCLPSRAPPASIA